MNKPRRKVVIEWTVILLIAVIASFVVRLYAVQTFFIPSGSMEPTLHVGDQHR
jgi:signal peptidase I